MGRVRQSKTKVPILHLANHVNLGPIQGDTVGMGGGRTMLLGKKMHEVLVSDHSTTMDVETSSV